MAKRRRLTPAQSDYLANPAMLETKSALRPGLPSGAQSPIAQVAGDASTIAAFQEVSDYLAAARSEGRLIQRLPLHAIGFHTTAQRSRRSHDSALFRCREAVLRLEVVGRLITVFF